MQLLTGADLKSALQHLGFSGRLNTAWISRMNVTVRNAGGSSGPPHLGEGSAVLMLAGPSGVVARLLSLCAPSPLPSSGAHAAASTRWQAGGATLSAANGSSGCRQDQSTMDGMRGALVPLAAGFRLRATQARCRSMSWGGRCQCQQKNSDGASPREEVASLACPMTNLQPETRSQGACQILHHILWGTAMGHGG
jgi:hypothetical protein